MSNASTSKGNEGRVVRARKGTERVTLSVVRGALRKTQAEVAEAAGMTQADVSKLEARGDWKISTLRRYAVALGGTVEIAIVVDGRRALVDV